MCQDGGVPEEDPLARTELTILLGLAFQVVLGEFVSRLDDAGYADLRPVHGMVFQALGRSGATATELELLGLVAAPEPPARPLIGLKHSYARSGNRKWPDYARCVEGAPLNQDKSGPDTGRADFVWCMTAISWGWSIEETAEERDSIAARRLTAVERP